MSRHQPDNEDYRWLSSILGQGAGRAAPVLARPSADRPELFLPLGSPAAAAASLARSNDGRSWLERLVGRSAMTLARVGMLYLAPGDRVDIGPFTAIEQIAAALGEPKTFAAITLGPRRRNRKPVVQLLRPNGTTIGFAKVGWSPFTRELVANEAEWLTRLEGRVPEAVEIPDVIATIDDDERLIVVTSPLATSAGSGRQGGLVDETIIELARSLGSRRVPFGELAQVAELKTGPVAHLVDVDALVDRHRSERVEVGIWHGDLTPWNTSTIAGRTMIWDWEFTNDERPVGFDLLHNSFELVRRSSPRNEVNALSAVRNRADALLASIGQPHEAVLDLYLCELIQREARLDGEGWGPAELGPLQDHAVEMLRDRLR